MNKDPVRNPESQALVFPPVEPEIDLLQNRVATLESTLSELLIYLIDQPRPSNREDERLLLCNLKAKLLP